MNTEQLIQKLSEPLATALQSLDMNYWFVSESQDDKFTYLEFDGDGPKIVVQIETKFSHHCNTCGSDFNEPAWDDVDICPKCCSGEIVELEE